MERLESLLAKVDKQIELIIRGGNIGGQPTSVPIDSVLVIKNTKDLFQHLISPSFQKEYAESEDKTARVNTAVRLHNKVRNLAPVCYVELRAIAKACAAWMLMLFNQPVPKSICAVIKLLSRAGQETQPFSESISLSCCTAATEMWTRISLQTLSQMMPPLELQDIKIAVFQAYLDRADILVRTNALQSLSGIRGAMSGAFDMVQLMPEGLKIQFAEQTVILGSRLSALNAMDEAVHLLQIAISSIELLGNTLSAARRSTESLGLSIVEKDELQKLKIKAQLSLAFAYKEMNQCDKAMVSILAVESTLHLQVINSRGATAVEPTSESVQSIMQTVNYAKFVILAQDGDWNAAEQSLKALLIHAPYDLAIMVIRSYLEGNQKDTKAKGVEFYRLLANKFPSEPEFTNTRICLVQHILLSAQLHDDGFAITCHKRALELCSEILVDNKSQKRKLRRSIAGGVEGNQRCYDGGYERMKIILSERVRWHRSTSQWESVIVWIDLLLRLLCEGGGDCDSLINQEQDDQVIAQLQKVDALIHLERKDEALTLALITVNQVLVTRTIVMTFLATLHAKGASKAVDALGTFQKDNRDGILSLIMMCAEVAKDAINIPPSERESAIIKLLQEWLTHYSACEAWQSELADNSLIEKGFTALDDDDIHEAISDGPTNYLAVACELVSRFLKQKLQKIRKRPCTRSPTQLNRTIDTTSVMKDEEKVGEIIDIAGEIHASSLAKEFKNEVSEGRKRPTGTEKEMLHNDIKDNVRQEVKRTRKNFQEESDIMDISSINSESARKLGSTSVATDDDDLLSSPPEDIENMLKPFTTSNSAHTVKLEESLRTDENDSTPNDTGVKNIFPPQKVSSNDTSGSPQTLASDVYNHFDPDNLSISGEYFIKRVELLGELEGVELHNSVQICPKMIVFQPPEVLSHIEEPDSISHQNQIVVPCDDQDPTKFDQSCAHILSDLPEYKSQKSYASLCGNLETVTNLNAESIENSDVSVDGSFNFCFNTSLLEVREVILDMLRGIVELYRILHQSRVGSFADLEWLGDLSWNMGCILVSEENFHSMDIFSEITISTLSKKPANLHISNSPQLPSDNQRMSSASRDFLSTDFQAENRDIRLAGAEFLEVSADLYALVPFADRRIGSKNQGMCLVLACSARLDAATFEDIAVSYEHHKEKQMELHCKSDTLLQSNLQTEGLQIDRCPDSSCLHQKRVLFVQRSRECPILLGPQWMEQNLFIARNAAAAASSLLASEAGFDDIGDDTRSFLKKVALVLEFSSLCKLQSAELQQFVESNEAELLGLSASQLKTCSDIACNEKGGTVDIARKMLNYSLQISQRDSAPDYKLMGLLFRKLIEMSPSRRDALDRVRHFEQLSSGMAYSGNIAEDNVEAFLLDDVIQSKDKDGIQCPFDPIDVDYITSIAFNYGLSLMDMNQIDLAEVFVSKALSLLPHASIVLLAWKERMQDTYMAVLKAKEAHNKREKSLVHSVASFELLHSANTDSKTQMANKNET